MPSTAIESPGRRQWVTPRDLEFKQLAWPNPTDKDGRIMGGRFGKYGDLKRRKALQRSRREKSRIKKPGRRTCQAVVAWLRIPKDLH